MKTRYLAALAVLTFLWTATPMVADDAGPGFGITPHHVGISVPDLEESIAWYHRMLGFELVRRLSKDADPKMSFVLLRRGDIHLELFQVDEGRDMPAYRFDPTADLHVHGVKHLAFQVEDARAAAAELAAKGARIVLGPIDSPRATYVFIADNAGIPFELIQFKGE
jgi:methylmalonyl-CoA/ethylmalonyl-CoA epimerase